MTRILSSQTNKYSVYFHMLLCASLWEFFAFFYLKFVVKSVCGFLPESTSSSQGIILKRLAVSAENDAASDSRCRTACLFQASGLLFYFNKSIRSEILHFQLPLTQIYCLHKSLLPLNHSYIVTHAYVWAAYHIPQFIYLSILLAPSILSSLSPNKASSYS